MSMLRVGIILIALSLCDGELQSASADSAQKGKKVAETLESLTRKLAVATKEAALAKDEAARTIAKAKALSGDANDDKKGSTGNAKAELAVKPVEPFKPDTQILSARLEALNEKVKVGLEGMDRLRKLKRMADEKFAKAKRKHAFEGNVDRPENVKTETDRQQFNALADAAKAKNEATKEFEASVEREKDIKKEVSRVSQDITLMKGAIPPSGSAAVNTVVDVLKQENAATVATIEAVAAERNANTAVEKKDNIADKILKLQEEAELMKKQTVEAKESTSKLGVITKEKTQKADVLEGLRSTTATKEAANEADFEMSNVANRVRKAKLSREAANKKILATKQTLTVLNEIDVEAKVQAEKLERYKTKEIGAKKSAMTVTDTSENNLSKLRAELMAIP